MTCRSFRNASSSPRPPKTTCATPTGGSASPRAGDRLRARAGWARRRAPLSRRARARGQQALPTLRAPAADREHLPGIAPRGPTDKHAPPSEAHPQWPQRAREDAVSSLPPRPLAPSGSGSSGRRTPALASAGASETATIARPDSGDPRTNASAVRRSCAPPARLTARVVDSSGIVGRKRNSVYGNDGASIGAIQTGFGSTR